MEDLPSAQGTSTVEVMATACSVHAGDKEALILRDGGAGTGQKASGRVTALGRFHSLTRPMSCFSISNNYFGT